MVATIGVILGALTWREAPYVEHCVVLVFFGGHVIVLFFGVFGD
jgi:hypothetical protein